MTDIKFFYNGLKVNGSMKLQKAHYSLIQTWENAATGRTIKDQIVIYARGYEGFSDEVRELFSVENDTDSQTDYFEKDRIRVFPSDPMFRAVLEGFEKQENRKIAAARRKGHTTQAADLESKLEYARNLALNEEISEEEKVEEAHRCDCAASNLDRHCTQTGKNRIGRFHVCGRHLNVLRNGGEIFEAGTLERIEERPETAALSVSASDTPEAAAGDEEPESVESEASPETETIERLNDLVADLRAELLKSEEEKKNLQSVIDTSEKAFEELRRERGELRRKSLETETEIAQLRKEFEGMRRDRNDRAEKVRYLREQIGNERRDGLDAALRKMIREELEIEIEEVSETSGESSYQSIKVSLRLRGDEEAFDEDDALISIS